MSQVIIQPETTKNPLTLIGKEAGYCWGSETTDDSKNRKRGIDCLKSNHGRTLEFPQVYMVLEGYSARVIREFYTHIGGSPTRLQASTRYIDYQKGFKYITPSSISNDRAALEVYNTAMNDILVALQRLEGLNIPREDSAMLLPLGMETKVVVRTNLRNLIDMSHQRLCSRTYWEYTHLMSDIMLALGRHSDEWQFIIRTCFRPKCEVLGYCLEKKGCGRKPKHDKM